MNILLEKPERKDNVVRFYFDALFYPTDKYPYGYGKVVYVEFKVNKKHFDYFKMLKGKATTPEQIAEFLNKRYSGTNGIEVLLHGGWGMN